MPYNVDIWIDDRDDGCFIIYIDRELITERGAQALQQILSTTVTGWQRLDESLAQATLRAVTG